MSAHPRPYGIRFNAYSRYMMQDIPRVFVASEKQRKFLRDLCSEFNLSYAAELAAADPSEKLSARLNELIGMRTTKRTKVQQATPNQLRLLRILGAKDSQLANITLAEASKLIKELKDAKAAETPDSISDAQRNYLETLEYTGPMPVQKSTASKLIQMIRYKQNINWVLQNAEAKGVNADQIQRLKAFLMTTANMFH